MSAKVDKSHYPLHWFLDGKHSRNKEALVIVNNNIHGLDKVIRKYWNSFSVKVCADGGSNILYDSFKDELEKYIPDAICGDLDSIRKEVLDFYKSKGSNIIERTSEDDTDLTKSLHHLQELKKLGKFQFSTVYILNGLGGRFDQTIANINCMYLNTDMTLYLVSEDSILFPLEPGNHKISTDSGLEEGHCGLIPLGECCTKCSTTGLKWNLGAHHQMKFGDLISTNNLIEDKVVSVSTSTTLLWTMSHTLLKYTL